MKRSRYFTQRTTNILVLALAFISLLSFALLAQVHPAVLATKVSSQKVISTQTPGDMEPVATPTLVDQFPNSPVQDPPLPITIPTPPINLPIPIPTLPSLPKLPIAIPTLPIPIPTLPIQLPVL
ncbi:MAG TPA: hypothetical protein VFN35_07850 [Ktedonobacteraceae bacterium]|nr:hypothetical protein [Ktedonobacteraceae bacterium]